LIPQTIARTGGALLLSSLYVYLHASLVLKGGRLRDQIQSRSARPALFGAVLLTGGGIGWYVFLPESAKAVLAAAGPENGWFAETTRPPRRERHRQPQTNRSPLGEKAA